jgi:A/G-specific adenine glycosylase
VRHARELLAWYDRHRRELPWRQTPEPYRVWLSEIMLQQTRVETAMPYFERFLARFPNVEELARAPVDEVLALWSGLGYYRRARQLHATARLVAARGGFPREVDALRELPGIGPYTAAAIASIAFGVAVPVLDGNVERVLSRLLATSEVRGTAARRLLLDAAAELLDPRRPGDSNQALMELGATLCTPRRPRCLICPLAAGCRAAATGNPERYPAPRPRRQVEKRRLVVAVAAAGGRTLLFRRPEGSPLLAGTWELPWVEPGEGEPEAGLAAKYGACWRLGPAVARVRHGITYRDFDVAVHRADLAAAGEIREALEAGWFDAAARAALPLSSLVPKVLSALPPDEFPAQPRVRGASRSPSPQPG